MINLGHNLFIDADDNNYVLKERKIATQGKNKGEERDFTIGYCSSIDNAVIRAVSVLCKRRVADGSINTLNEFIQAQTGLYRAMRDDVGKVR